jgi:hypothetical protein
MLTKLIIDPLSSGYAGTLPSPPVHAAMRAIAAGHLFSPRSRFNHLADHTCDELLALTILSVLSLPSPSGWNIAASHVIHPVVPPWLRASSCEALIQPIDSMDKFAWVLGHAGNLPLAGDLTDGTFCHAGASPVHHGCCCVCRGALAARLGHGRLGHGWGAGEREREGHARVTRVANQHGWLARVDWDPACPCLG